MQWQDELVRLGMWSTHHGSAILDTVDKYYHGSDDCKKAYRRIPCRNLGLMVVCLFNPETKTVEYFIIPGFCFGYYSAVLGWNRITALLYTHLGRCLLAIPATGYYDDFQIGGPWIRRIQTCQVRRARRQPRRLVRLLPCPHRCDSHARRHRGAQGQATHRRARRLRRTYHPSRPINKALRQIALRPLPNFWAGRPWRPPASSDRQDRGASGAHPVFGAVVTRANLALFFDAESAHGAPGSWAAETGVRIVLLWMEPAPLAGLVLDAEAPAAFAFFL